MKLNFDFLRSLAHFSSPEFFWFSHQRCKKFKAHVLQRIKQASRGLAPFDYLFIENTLPTEIKYYPQSG